jgi:isopentenyl-diphosphate delta-isomerase type 1
VGIYLFMKKTKVVVVDQNDNVIGAAYKEDLSVKGLIHRIVRVFIFNSKNQIYLQKRASNMETWPNKWDQSVGGHVDEEENYEQAAKRETEEELGIKNITLKEITKFYTEEIFGGKTKKRFNMLYEGKYDGKINLQEEEISNGDWFDIDYVEKWMEETPDDFVPACIETFKRYKENTK